MNKISKILSILLVAIVLISVSQSCVFAAGATTGSTIVGGVSPDTNVDISGLQSMAGKVLGLIQGATAVLAVVLIAVFGFKFVLGSAQEKADYQKSFIPLIVGVVVVFAAVSIAKLIFSITGT